MNDFNMGENSERNIADVKLSISEKQSHVNESKGIPHMDKEQLRDLILTLDEKIKTYIRYSRNNFERALEADQRKEKAECRLEELSMGIKGTQ